MRALMATEPGGDEVMAASDDYITKGELITSLLDSITETIARNLNRGIPALMMAEITATAIHQQITELDIDDDDKLDLMCCVASLAAVRLAASGIATVS